MSRKLFIHIGGPKTGSTSIQSTLFHNRKALHNSGFSYPAHPRLKHAGNLPRMIRQHGNGEALKRSLLEHLADDSGASNVIISSEFLFLLQKRDFEAFFRIVSEHFQTNEHKIISYVRPHAEYLESQFRQNATGLAFRHLGTVEELGKWVGKRILNSLNHFKHHEILEKIVGKGNVIVRPYGRDELFGNDVVSDFSKVVGIPGHLDISSEKNESQSAKAAVLLSLIRTSLCTKNSDNTWPNSPHRGGRIGVSYAGILRPHIESNIQDNGSQILSCADRVMVRKIFRDDTEKFCDKWMRGRNDFFEKPISNDIQKVSEDDLTPDEYIRLISDLTEEIFRLRFSA